MKQTLDRTDDRASRPSKTARGRARGASPLPARLTWKDQRGTTRFASVVTRNVSEFGVYVECQSPVSIPLYRLVQFQLERDVRDADGAAGRRSATAACSRRSIA